MSNIFGNLNQQAKSPYISIEENEQVKNIIFARLGNVKEFVFASEDGETPCPAKYFMEILENYRFQFAEVSKMQKGDIWLADGDQFVIAKF